MVFVFLSMPVLMMGADTTTTATRMTAAEIVEKNVTARGGLAAWRGVKTMSMTGKMDAGGNNRPTLPAPNVRKTRAQMPAPRPAEQVQLPFVMELDRPRKVRLEVQFNGQTAIQVYDGANGWKLRPFLNRHEVEPYTAEELKLASLQADLDGPLVDYAAKGSKIEVVGMESVEGHDTYKLKVTTKDGRAQHIWVDTKTFLEAKMEGNPRSLDGKLHSVDVYFRDYRPAQGLMIPHLLETAVSGVSSTEKIQIEKVEINPKLDDSLFTKPK
jgi:outer membrane lipoprotein-sorting protein